MLDLKLLVHKTSFSTELLLNSCVGTKITMFLIYLFRNLVLKAVFIYFSKTVD